MCFLIRRGDVRFVSCLNLVDTNQRIRRGLKIEVSCEYISADEALTDASSTIFSSGLVSVLTYCQPLFRNKKIPLYDYGDVVRCNNTSLILAVMMIIFRMFDSCPRWV